MCFLKAPSVTDLDEFRMIALSSTLCKWYMILMIQLLWEGHGERCRAGAQERNCVKRWKQRGIESSTVPPEKKAATAGFESELPRGLPVDDQGTS